MGPTSSFFCALLRSPRVVFTTIGLFIALSTVFVFLPVDSKPHYLTIQHWTLEKDFAELVEPDSAPQVPPSVILATTQSQLPHHDDRLERTLHRNEEKYQESIQARYELMKKTRAQYHDGPLQYLPLFPDARTALWQLWDFFTPAFSCPFPVDRVGTLGDGGKFVCGLERALSQENCVIYSMGVEQQSSFEETILENFPHCQIFGFDFSVSDWGPQLLAKPHLLDRAHFNPYKIGEFDDHKADPKIYSMQGIMKEKGHQFVDVLKMDIEGAEFNTLATLIKSFKGQPLPFGQLQVEIHAGWSGLKTVSDFDHWWSILEEAGLRPFWTEPNLLHANFFRAAPDVSEWSFINIKGKHPLVDPTLPSYP